MIMLMLRKKHQYNLTCAQVKSMYNALINQIRTLAGELLIDLTQKKKKKKKSQSNLTLKLNTNLIIFSPRKQKTTLIMANLRTSILKTDFKNRYQWCQLFS